MRKLNQDEDIEDEDSSMDEDDAEEETEMTPEHCTGTNNKVETTLQDSNGEEDDDSEDTTESAAKDDCDSSGVGNIETTEDEKTVLTAPTTSQSKEESNSDESDLEDLSHLNRSHRPYRDNPDMPSSDITMEDDVESATTSIDAAEVRKRVKQSLMKKQHASRRKKKGEAGAITRARRERKDDVNQSVSALQNGW